MDKDLKPRPFCGGEAIIGHVAKNRVEIKCTRCFVKRTQRCLRHSSEWLEGKMIEKWNTRATDSHRLKALDSWDWLRSLALISFNDEGFNKGVCVDAYRDAIKQVEDFLNAKK